MSQAEIITHIQDSVRVGEHVDLVYANSSNSVKQASATTVENRFSVGLQSLSFGSSNTVLFNPDEGLTDVVLTATLPPPQGALTYAGLALPRNWLASAVRRLGVRYSGSTLYYFDKEQLLIDNMSDAEDSVKRDQLTQLSGQACLTQADFADPVKRTGYIALKLPHTSVSAQEKPLPLPTELITSPVQINIEWERAENVFIQSAVVAGGQPVLPSAFSSATVQFKQVHFDDRADQLCRRFNMSEQAYSYPIKYFSQEVFKINNVKGGDQNLTLTGLRSGNCIGIRVWVRDNLNTSTNFPFVLPSSLRLSVNGLIYFDSQLGNSQLWNLLDRKTASEMPIDAITVSAGSFAIAPATAYWTEVPFSQHSEVLANESELVMGLSIMNSIVNLQLSLPTHPDVNGNDVSNYTVVAEYLFNTSLMFSRGTCEYVW
jgi:hypothetical protein